MTWSAIARADLRELGRSRLLWLATGVVAALSGIGAAIPSAVAADGTPPYTVGVETLFIVLGTVAPFVALGLGGLAVVGARESGTMRFLLGLPNRRADVLVGRAVSRVAIATTVAALGGLAGLGVLVWLYDGVHLGGPATVVLGLVAYSSVYAAVGVAVSASVDSTAKAVGGTFAAYLLLFVLWTRIPQALYWLLNGELPAGDVRPDWYALLVRLNPGTAIGDLTVARFDWMRNGEYVSQEPTAAMVAGNSPFFLSDLAGVAVVLLWLLGPLAVGYAVFRRLPAVD